ncbi:GNAT family N-acetyltransferase [Bacillus sp. 165]|uniref:GNAT family N-acetyltransferase n=1 Tax=Bacillus sp. 165 TaxID=1529117 RepID=UPI001ADBD088|nr:GNAT family N-acetyltransferase [Bacillus sp. 165]MBO9128433.1 GNAT family N-acetyltransferase [Bacillus sp. 165]
MTIRQARKDDRKEIAILLNNALHDIAVKLSGGRTQEEVLEGLEELFIQEGNRLSYEHTIVKEINGRIVGLIVTYHGKDSNKVDRFIIERLRKLKNDPSITLEKEAQEDEYYIDTLSVSPLFFRKGIGSSLIREAEQRAKQLGHNKIALLAEETNERAYSLYKKLNYTVDSTVYLLGAPYAHFVKYL